MKYVIGDILGIRGVIGSWEVVDIDRVRCRVRVQDDGPSDEEYDAQELTIDPALLDLQPASLVCGESMGKTIRDSEGEILVSKPLVYVSQNISIKRFPSCECGAHKVNDVRHSTWCPMYKEDNK